MGSEQLCCPSKYVPWLADKMREHNARVWLVNTGWGGGGYGVGKRIKLAHTRVIVNASHSKALVEGRRQKHHEFGFDVVTECPNVSPEILWLRDARVDGAAYDPAAKKLAAPFVENVKKHEGGVSAEDRAASPLT